MRVAPAWTLGVLAGGFSRRFGQDKADVPFGDTTLLGHTIRRLAPAGVPVIVATRPDGPGRDAGVPWVPDVIPGAGPLSGAAALLGACETPYLLVVACDTPFLPADLGDRFLSRVPGVDGVVLSAEGRPEPLPCLLSAELGGTFCDLLEAGHRRADAWLAHAAAQVIPFAELFPDLEPGRALHNVNSRDDLALVDPNSGH